MVFTEMSLVLSQYLVKVKQVQVCGFDKSLETEMLKKVSICKF